MLSVCSQPSAASGGRTQSAGALQALQEGPSPDRVLAAPLTMSSPPGVGDSALFTSPNSVHGTSPEQKSLAAGVLDVDRQLDRAKSSPDRGPAALSNHQQMSANGAAIKASLADEDMNRWFHSMKANLEHFGNVDVFIDESPRECACCLEQMATAFRIRPRRCQHVFHIECLLQWWTEGTCPVCRQSFAPDTAVVEAHQNGKDMDRYSMSSSTRGRRHRSPSPARMGGGSHSGASDVAPLRVRGPSSDVSGESRRAPSSAL